MFKVNTIDNTAESCIEILSGVHPTHEFDGTGVDKSDKTLLLSLTKQLFKGTAFTDRQYELAKSKIILYKELLEKEGINVDSCIDTLRMPLRTIDRSKWIGIREYDGSAHIAVRFTFNKKLISVIDGLRYAIKNKKQQYDEVLKIHYFPLTESNIYKIIKLFEGKNFTIEEELQKKYEVISMMHNNKKDYIPGVYSFKLKNLAQKAVDYIVTDIGAEPNEDNLSLYKDRRYMYGIEHFDESDVLESCKNLTTLSKKIVEREHTQVLVDERKYTTDNVIESVLELNRYPLLVILSEENDLEELTQLHQSLRNIFPQEDHCVLYRKDNNSYSNTEFNKYIKENKLNNSLDVSTKIVYTKHNKLVKTLLKSEWRPKSAFVFGCTRTNKNTVYINELDLVMFYDTDVSPFLTRGCDLL